MVEFVGDDSILLDYDPAVERGEKYVRTGVHLFEVKSQEQFIKSGRPDSWRINSVVVDEDDVDLGATSALFINFTKESSWKSDEWMSTLKVTRERTENGGIKIVRATVVGKRFWAFVGPGQDPRYKNILEIFPPTPDGKMQADNHAATFYGQGVVDTDVGAQDVSWDTAETEAGATPASPASPASPGVETTT